MSNGVIFDMDGVLVDSYQAHFRSWQQVAREYGLSIGEEEFARSFGRTSREVIRQLWPGRLSDEQIAEFDRKKEAAYRQILEQAFPEMDGAGDLIVALHEAGFTLAIGSSGPPENVAVVLRHLSHANLIRAVTNGSEVQRGKPDPQVFLIAAGKLHLEPARCAVIEDAPVGVEAARRAGMVPIGLTGTAPRAALARWADLVVDSLRELTPERIAQLISAPH